MMAIWDVLWHVGMVAWFVLALGLAWAWDHEALE